MGITTGTIHAATGEQINPFAEFGLQVGMGVASGGLFDTGKDLLKYPIMGGGWSSRFGMAAKSGALMPFGFELGPHGTSFMGWRDVAGEMRQAGAAHVPGSLREAWKMPESRTSMKMKGFGAALQVGFTAHAVYQGYKQDGFWGATKALGGQMVSWAGFKVGEAAIHTLVGGKLGAVMWPATMVAGAAYGGYKALEWGRDTRRGLRNLEMTTPVLDPFGTGFTMRQRSVAAIQKSYINGRMALGREASLLHR